MSDKCEYNIADLISAISKFPTDAKVKIVDADTLWTIPKFGVRFDQAENVLWLDPCDYNEMER